MSQSCKETIIISVIKMYLLRFVVNHLQEKLGFGFPFWAAGGAASGHPSRPQK